MTRIEPDSHVPVYLQIVEHLRGAIAAGVYKAGEALPSLRVLATDMRVNPNTVQRRLRRAVSARRRRIATWGGHVRSPPR